MATRCRHFSSLHSAFEIAPHLHPHYWPQRCKKLYSMNSSNCDNPNLKTVLAWIHLSCLGWQKTGMVMTSSFLWELDHAVFWPAVTCLSVTHHTSSISNPLNIYIDSLSFLRVDVHAMVKDAGNKHVAQAKEDFRMHLAQAKDDYWMHLELKECKIQTLREI